MQGTGIHNRARESHYKVATPILFFSQQKQGFIWKSKTAIFKYMIKVKFAALSAAAFLLFSLAVSRN